MLTIRVVAVLAFATWLGAPITAAEPVKIETAGVTLLEKADVAAQEAGRLSDLKVVEGRAIAAGNVLAQLEDDEARLQVEKFRIQRLAAEKAAGNDVRVRLARQAMALADSDVQRSEESLRRFPMSVTESQLDRLRLLASKAKLEVEQAERELDTAKISLQAAANDVELAEALWRRRKIVAPIAGQVVEVKRRKGEWVQPGETLLRIVRTDRLRVEGFIPAALATGELTGRRAVLRATVAGVTREFPAVVTFVSPEINPVNGQVRVLAEVDNPDGRLRPGLIGSLVVSGEANAAPSAIPGTK